MTKTVNNAAKEGAEEGPTRWWRRASAKIGLIPIGTLLAVVAFTYSYKTTGAEELRTQVYQPLFTDLSNLELSVQLLSVENLPTTKRLAELRESGFFGRPPVAIQRSVLRVSDHANAVYAAAISASDTATREVSARIMKVRTEDADRRWREKTSAELRAQSQSGNGISDAVTMTFGHAGRSRSIDVRDPQRPVVSGPGGPSFLITDWLGYPQSVPAIEKLWGPLDYLYFAERTDTWYYRLSREDLARSATTLRLFLEPVYQAIQRDHNFLSPIT